MIDPHGLRVSHRPIPAEYLGTGAAEPVTAAFSDYATPLLGGPLPAFVHLA